MPPAPTLRRETFKTSRLAEFCSRRELVNQTGHAVEEWPFVILKELSDNALDACEEAHVAPVIDVVVSNDGIIISDNGPGLSPETVADMLDYTSRVSSREAYASPTRGAQGNALKTILAMPFALDGECGEVLIESQGVAHSIIFTIDRIRQTPQIEHVQEPSKIRTGARVTVRWPNSACSILIRAGVRFLQLAAHYAWVNPHLTLSVLWTAGTGEDGEPVTHRLAFRATEAAWPKWSPTDPTSPHWYDRERLARLIAAKITHSEDHGRPCPTVREFIAEFRGLTATAKGKAICDALGVARMSLAEFYDAGAGQVGALLSQMREHSSPVKPKDIGIIGLDHFLAKFRSIGVDPESFDYRRVAIECDGVPYVAEAAFGCLPRAQSGRHIVTGLNWSVAIGPSPFRSLGGYGLDDVLSDQWADQDEPIAFALHVASPTLEFTDRGKSAIRLPDEVDQKVAKLVRDVTAKWAKQRKAEHRHIAARQRRNDVMLRRRRMTIKAAARTVLPAAYMKASANGTLPANARQIYYAARGPILELTGKESLDAQYFCQTVLVDYIEEHDLDWDVVWDDRGHFIEPHTECTIGLGTLSVRKYLASNAAPALIKPSYAPARIDTHGPQGRYGAVMFIEKEGFSPLIKAMSLAERRDLGIMSSKGMSVTAARMLADGLCGRYGIPLFVLHDFDIAAFSIRHTLTANTRRYKFVNKLEVIDIGLRLADVVRLGLEFEAVEIRGDREKLRQRLTVNGATKAEIDFLLSGRRVELNAIPSDVFITMIEQKLDQNGLKKILPDAQQLADVYRLLKHSEQNQRIVEEVLARRGDFEITVPEDLEQRVRSYLEANPAETWDEAIEAIVGEGEVQDEAESGSSTAHGPQAQEAQQEDGGEE